MSANRTECGGGRHRRAFGGCNGEAKSWSRKVRRRADGEALDEELRLEHDREETEPSPPLTVDDALVVWHGRDWDWVV